MRTLLVTMVLTFGTSGRAEEPGLAPSMEPDGAGTVIEPPAAPEEIPPEAAEVPPLPGTFDPAVEVRLEQTGKGARRRLAWGGPASFEAQLQRSFVVTVAPAEGEVTEVMRDEVLLDLGVEATSDELSLTVSQISPVGAELGATAELLAAAEQLATTPLRFTHDARALRLIEEPILSGGAADAIVTLLLGEVISMRIGLPAEPVGRGAHWVSSQALDPEGIHRMEVTAQLVSRRGRRAVIDVSSRLVGPTIEGVTLRGGGRLWLEQGWPLPVAGELRLEAAEVNEEGTGRSVVEVRWVTR